jgi:hypothetical protein
MRVYGRSFDAESVGSSGWTHAPALALLLSLQLQQFLNDLIGIDLQVVIQMVGHNRAEILVGCSDLEVALHVGSDTWYLRRELSLSLETSNNSSALLFAIEFVISAHQPPP